MLETELSAVRESCLLTNVYNRHDVHSVASHSLYEYDVMARHVRGNLDVIARHSYVEYDAGHSQCQVIRCEGSSMKMCIDRPEKLPLGLSIHEDKTSVTCYVMSLTRASLTDYDSEPHCLWLARQAGVMERGCMAYLLWLQHDNWVLSIR